MCLKILLLSTLLSRGGYKDSQNGQLQVSFLNEVFLTLIFK